MTVRRSNCVTKLSAQQQGEVTWKWRWCRRRINWSRQRVLVRRQWYEQCKRYQPYTDSKERQDLQNTTANIIP